MKTLTAALLTLTLACTSKPEAHAPEVAAMGADPTVKLSAEGVENAQIQVVTVQAHTFSPRLVVGASISADPQNMAKVGAHMSGRVAGIHVGMGDTVKRGQALVDIDTVEIHHVTTDYLTAVARAREATDALARQKQLVTERVGALQDLRRAEAAAETANATLHEGEEHLHFLGLTTAQIDAIKHGTAAADLHSVVRAPISGRIDALSVALGQVLVGTEDLMTILQPDAVWATLRVFERDLPNVQNGAAVDVRVTSYPERKFVGTVKSLSNLVDPATHTVEVRVQLENADETLKPGMTAEAGITLQASSASLWLPIDAVQQHGADRVVFTQTHERTYKALKVVVGDERGGYVPVTAGLPSATPVVVHGAFALRGELERSEIQGE